MNPKKHDGLLPDDLPDVTPREVRAVERAASDADTDPGEGPAERPRSELETREHVAQTRPEGVRRRPVPVVGADEVTDPEASEAREEVPTRPRDVIAVRRR